jgi:hypothetical protein
MQLYGFWGKFVSFFDNIVFLNSPAHVKQHAFIYMYSGLQKYLLDFTRADFCLVVWVVQTRVVAVGRCYIGANSSNPKPKLNVSLFGK